MQIWQRGTSFSAIGYTADRWSFYAGTSPVVTQSTDVPAGFRYSAALSGTGSTGFTQKIESYNVSDLSGQTITVSFWLKQSTGAGANAIAISLSYATAQDNFGSTTSISSQNITTTSSWAYYTATFTNLPSGVTNGLQCTIVTNSGSAVAFQLTGVQLEAGSAASPFENRLYGVELQLCQRYYYQSATSSVYMPRGSGGVAYSSSGVEGCAFMLTVPMRATPTFGSNGLNFYSPYLGRAAGTGTVGIYQGNPDTIYFNNANNGSGFSTGAVYFLAGTSVNSYISFSAEL
jgi:hypothetical protein